MGEAMASRIGLLLPLLILALAKPRSNALFLAGLLIAALGEGMRIWTAGTLPPDDERKDLVREGPYSIVRHPFYLGSILVLGGIVLLSISWRHWLRGLILLALSAAALWRGLLPPIEEEERELETAHGEAFRAYRSAVPRLLPAVDRLKPQGGRWSWSRLRASREHWNIIALALFAFILRVKMTYRL